MANSNQPPNQPAYEDWSHFDRVSGSNQGRTDTRDRDDGQQQRTVHVQKNVGDLIPTGGGQMESAGDGQFGDILSLLISKLPPERSVKRLAQDALEIGERFGGTKDRAGKSSAIYSIPFGKGEKQTKVEGPTVWIMEALLAAFKHTIDDVAIQDMGKSPNGNQMVRIKTRILDLLTVSVSSREHVFTLSKGQSGFAEGESADRWTSMQMQSAVSKAKRGCIEHFLPRWYQNIAVNAARDAMSSRLLRDSNSKAISLDEAIVGWLGAFRGKYKVTEAQLEALMEKERALWVLEQLAILSDLWRQLNAGEVSLKEVFPPAPPPEAAVAGPSASGLSDIKGDEKPKVETTQGARHASDAQREKADEAAKAAPVEVKTDPGPGRTGDPAFDKKMEALVQGAQTYGGTGSASDPAAPAASKTAPTERRGLFQPDETKKS